MAHVGTDEARVTYRAVLSNREFSAMLFSQALSKAGDQLARIAVAVLVFGRTGSGLAASATYAVSYLTYLIAGPVLSALSDRYPRRTVMVVCDLLRAPVVLLLCIPGAPLAALFACLLALAVLAPAFDSSRSAVQPEILEGDAYVAGNALINIVLQVGEVVGFVLGGVLVAALSVRGALVIDAGTYLVSAALLLLLLRHRDAAQAPDARGSLWGDTLSGVRYVRQSPDLLRYLAFSIIGSAALITPEGLAVPMAEHLGHGSTAAGILTAAVPAGFVLSSLVLVRLEPARRLQLLFPLALLGLLTLLVTPLVTSVVWLTVVWTIAGLGAGLNLVASAAYVQSCPSEYRSRAYGVAATALFSVQGIALVASGALADAWAPGPAVASVSAVMLVALLSVPSLRRVQGNGRSRRTSP